MKKFKIKIPKEEIRFIPRSPIKPSKIEKVKTKYNRKQKHKKNHLND